MATVPVYDESVPVETAAQPAPQLAPITEAASGAGPAAALTQAGGQTEEHFSRLNEALIYRQHIQAQENAYNLGAKAAAEIQDKVADLTSRQGSNAHGILSGFVGPVQEGQPEKIKYEDSYDGFSEKLRGKYLEMAGSEYERKLLTRTIDSHLTVARNAVVKHEVQQGKVAFNQSVDANINALMNTGAAAATPGDLMKVMNQGADLRENQAKLNGEADKTTLDMLRLKTDDDFAETAIKANVERDPEGAMRLFDGVKNHISESMQGKLQAQIDGKMLDLRRGAVWEQVRGFVHPDGMVDLSKAEAEAAKLVNVDTVPPGQRQHILDFVRQQSAVQDAAVKDARKEKDRQFVNDALKAKNNGVSYQDAEDHFFKKMGYGFDEKDKDEKIRQLQALYTHDESFYDTAMKHQTEDQKLAWQEVEELAKGKYGKQTAQLPGDETQTPLASAFVTEMKHQLIGAPADKIRAIAREKLKDVVVQPGYLWDTKKPAWQVDRDITTMQAVQRNALENRYGTSLVNQAHAYLTNQGLQNPSPKQIKELIDRIHRGK